MAKSRMFFKILSVVLLVLSEEILLSQESADEKFSVGADLYSSYVWRGTSYGTGPHIQPLIKYTSGSFTAGGWGSFDFNGYQEADLFFAFDLPGGFSLGMTDYYYPALEYFDFSESAGSHAFEVNGGYSAGGLALSGNIVLNTAGGAGSSGRDLYFQAGYYFKSFSLLMGGGNGWHTSDGGFNLCNIGFGTTRTIKISESFSIPVTGQIIINPDRQKMYITIGFTL